MLFALGAAIVALACVVASAPPARVGRRADGLEPRMVAEGAARASGPRRRASRSLRAALASDERFAWERDLLAAFDEADERQRDALVNEQLLELEGRLTRSARVPRVCASIATSAGLLFGSLALRAGPRRSGGEADVAASQARSRRPSAPSRSASRRRRSASPSTSGPARIATQRRAAIDELVTRLQRLRSP